MKITKCSEFVELCEERGYRAWRASSPSTFGGLSAQIVKVDGEDIIFSVSTGGPMAGKFLEPDGHALLIVDSTVRKHPVELGARVVKLSVNYEHGNRSNKPAAEIQLRVEELIRQFIIMLFLEAHDSIGVTTNEHRAWAQQQYIQDCLETAEELGVNLHALRTPTGAPLYNDLEIASHVQELRDDITRRCNAAPIS